MHRAVRSTMASIRRQGVASAVLALGLILAAGADPLQVTVTDGQTGAPLAGAFVLVGSRAGEPFSGNFGWTDAGGAIAFDDPALVGPQTVTAALADYAHCTVYQAAAGAVGLPLFPAVLDSTMGGTRTHVEGTVTNIAVTNNDGNLDVALIVPAMSISDYVLAERLPFSFGLETITFPIIGPMDLPENSFAPNQVEFYIYSFQKSPWRIDVAGQRPVTFTSVSGRISIDALLSGATLDDVVIREVGVERDVQVAGPMSLTINSDLDLTRSLTTLFANVPAGATIDAVSGARLPSGGREVIVVYAANQAGIDTVSSFLLASRLPGGDLSDAVNIAFGRYSDSSGQDLFSAGCARRDGFGLPHSATFDDWLQIPDLAQEGRVLGWSDPTSPGVSPAPTWTRSVLGLRPAGGGLPLHVGWRIYAPTTGAGQIELPVLPPEAPGPAGGVPDPGQTPEDDLLYWELQAANPPGDPGTVAAGFLEGATHWSRRWMPIEIATAGVAGGPSLAAAMRLAAAPNPAIGRVDFCWSAGLRGPARLEIVSLDGRRVHAEAVELARGAAAWDARSAGRPLPAGCYWVRLVQEGRVIGRAPWMLLE